MHQTCVCVLQKEVGVMYVQLSSVSSRLGSRLSLIVRVNLVLNTCRAVVVDSDWCFDNLCGSHRLSRSEFYHVTWWYYTLVIDLIGQLRRDVIGCLSVKPWCHWLWRLVKLLLKWLLGSNLSQLYLATCEIALSTLLRLRKWASVDERYLSQRVRGWNGYISTPPLPSAPQMLQVHLYVDQWFQMKWMNEKSLVSFLTPLIV